MRIELQTKPKYCCSKWTELDWMTQAQHKLADTQEWRDFKRDAEYKAYLERYTRCSRCVIRCSRKTTG